MTDELFGTIYLSELFLHICISLFTKSRVHISKTQKYLNPKHESRNLIWCLIPNIPPPNPPPKKSLQNYLLSVSLFLNKIGHCRKMTFIHVFCYCRTDSDTASDVTSAYTSTVRSRMNYQYQQNWYYGWLPNQWRGKAQENRRPSQHFNWTDGTTYDNQQRNPYQLHKDSPYYYGGEYFQ